MRYAFREVDGAPASPVDGAVVVPTTTAPTKARLRGNSIQFGGAVGLARAVGGFARGRVIFRWIIFHTSQGQVFRLHKRTKRTPAPPPARSHPSRLAELTLTPRHQMFTADFEQNSRDFDDSLQNSALSAPVSRRRSCAVFRFTPKEWSSGPAPDAAQRRHFPTQFTGSGAQVSGQPAPALPARATEPTIRFYDVESPLPLILWGTCKELMHIPTHEFIN
ncbi:hypothetical protein EVAR_47348_1 [Eumeta japonica]|uniref:Uncharacterized protein n=1 Tax=Eumeta variegata TaxID=151549 RepID=A0A4C1WWC5_EUMVA|nr:hypothetical protein EVAR_47348_1 [Eumeta japonica]